jgi:hypothetical protein
VQLTAFAAGAVWGVARTGAFASLGINPRIGPKWGPSLAATDFAAYKKPSVATGEHFRRRAGRRTDVGRILAGGAEASGIADHPYADAPPVRVSFGRYGFRDEYPAVEGGTALIGSSYVEAAFANAEDTIPGWLRRDHGIDAANFGVAFSGGYTALHVLTRYALPTRPAEVVWVFAERAAFERLVGEARKLRTPARTAVFDQPIGEHLRETLVGFSSSALLRARLRLYSWFPDRVDRLPEQLARMQPVADSPHGSIELAGEEVPVDVSLLWKSGYRRRAPPLLAEVLAKMKAATEARGIGFRVLYIPSRHRLLEGLWIRRPAGRRGLPNLFALVAQECRALGIPVIDATPALRARLEEGVLVINPIHDQHLNAEGMRIVAQLIAAE